MGNILRNLDWSVIPNMLLTVIPALICVTLHECAHGLTAYKLGDPTAKLRGRLTLNPVKHIDVIGLLMMAVFGFGWAKPVPVDMRHFKNPKRGMAVTALAGPVSNIVIAAIFMLIYGIVAAFFTGDTAEFILEKLVWRTATLSCALAVFNILPIPPLDGSKVLFSFLPDTMYAQLMRYERFGFVLLIVIINTDVFDKTIGAATVQVAMFLSHIANFAYRILV